jgi:prophage regulatory protein
MSSEKFANTSGAGSASPGDTAPASQASAKTPGSGSARYPTGARTIWRRARVREATGLSDATLWRKARDGAMPAPVRLGPNSIGWYADEIEAWLATRPRVRGKDDEPRQR